MILLKTMALNASLNCHCAIGPFTRRMSWSHRQSRLGLNSIATWTLDRFTNKKDMDSIIRAGREPLQLNSITIT